jgi:hypothetical protein
MTRQEKIQLAIERGITCDVNTGKIYNIKGYEFNKLHSGRYKVIGLHKNNKSYKLLQHQFIYYIATGKIVEQIDHINGDKADNRIVNLREVTNQENQHNQTKAKGYSWDKNANKWHSCIKLNSKKIYLGLFNTEVEAHNAYLEAKKIYHIIN